MYCVVTTCIVNPYRLILKRNLIPKMTLNGLSTD